MNVLALWTVLVGRFVHPAVHTLRQYLVVVFVQRDSVLLEQLWGVLSVTIEHQLQVSHVRLLPLVQFLLLSRQAPLDQSIALDCLVGSSDETEHGKVSPVDTERRKGILSCGLVGMLHLISVLCLALDTVAGLTGRRKQGRGRAWEGGRSVLMGECTQL